MVNDNYDFSSTAWLHRYAIMAAIWSALVAGSLWWSTQQESRNTLSTAAAVARANISKDLTFRRWATAHGGVYVSPTEQTPPNPYLKLPDRDVVTTTGKKLTLMNPAYMLRELQNDFPDDYGNRSHITSLKLLNPKNAPDDWETGALYAFERGEKERQEVQQIDGQPYLRMMLPLIAESGCLKCHGVQGYKVGDIRGGLSTSIPLASYLAREKKLGASMALTHGAIWLIGLAGLGYSYRRERKLSSEHKLAEEQLRRNEQSLSEAQRIAHLGSWQMDFATNQVVWSEELYKMYGFDPVRPPPLYTESMKLFAPDSWKRLSAALAQIRETGIPYELELEAVPKDGGRRWMWARGELVHDTGGMPVGARGVVMDITERKLAENALREKEERLALATVNNGVGIWDWNLQTQEMIWDDSMYALYHIRRDDFSGTEEAWRAALHPDDLARGDQEVADAISGKKPFETEFRVLWPNGEIRHIKAVAKVFRDDQGTPLRMLGINMDISERKKAEEGLLERERHSQSLLRLSRNMERSQTYAEVLNAAREEVRNIVGYQSLWVYLLSDDKQYLKAIVAGGAVSDTVMSEEGTATLTIKGDRMLEEIAASKEIVLVEDARTDERVNKEIVERMGMRTILNIPIMLFDRHLGCVGTGTFGDEGVRLPSDSERKYLVAMASHMAVALDRIHLMVERKKAEQELRELNNDFITLLENTGDFIYLKDKDSRIRFCSQTLANITGYHSWHDMIGKHDLEIFPADTARIYYEEELPVFRDGKPLLNKIDPYYDAMGRPGWVSTNKWPVFGDDNKTVVGVFGISRDITELKQAEDKINELNRDLERRVVERTAQLEDANQELETFSYSVSHDLRTPLRAIDGFSHILQDEYADKLDEEGRRLLKVVRDGTVRMGQLIDDILRFSRTSRLEMSFSEIDMEELARSVLEELQPAGRKLQVEIEHLPPTVGDRSMMHQVFVNLLSNAIKFSGSRESAMISVGGSIEGSEAVYFVRDNGAGFDMQFADRLFGVFQRLHGMNEFEGTGIGLAIVKRIIIRHGGRVWAEGKVNQGATFYFALPAMAANQE